MIAVTIVHFDEDFVNKFKAAEGVDGNGASEDWDDKEVESEDADDESVEDKGEFEDWDDEDESSDGMAKGASEFVVK